jgi:hypothetical protein
MRAFLLSFLALAVLAASLAWLARRDDATATATVAAAASVPAPRPRIEPVAAVPHAQPERRLQVAQDLQLADHTYCSYRDSTKYPFTSRPIAEQPDQVYPNAPVTEAHAMRLDGGDADPNVSIQASQTRVWLASGESVAFSLRAVGAGGTVLPMVITRAVAQGLTPNGKRAAAQVTLAFADDGNGADPVAGDSAFAAVLAPGQTALAGFAGAIRTDVRYSVAGRSGKVLFDVLYSPEAPGAWTGQVREAVENGSLNFYLKADIRQGGRYVVTGRVDDAKGRPFALATFNDLLPSGPNEIKLTVFGKLLRDVEPAQPLTLRDVDGYLLKENADPDRALMPRLTGRAAIAATHALNAFSDAEWQGEERSRYLARFGQDLARARAAYSQFDPQAPMPPSACAENSANRQ